MGMTKKQKALLQYMLDPEIPNTAVASRLAGYASPQSAYAAVKSADFQDALQTFLRVLELKGVDDHKIAQTIANGLDAEEIKFFSKDGIVEDERVVTDHATRHKFVETVVKIRKLINTDNTSLQDNRKLIIVVGDKGLDGIL
jgi:hypothetical protein